MRRQRQREAAAAAQWWTRTQTLCRAARSSEAGPAPLWWCRGAGMARSRCDGWCAVEVRGAWVPVATGLWRRRRGARGVEDARAGRDGGCTRLSSTGAGQRRRTATATRRRLRWWRQRQSMRGGRWGRCRRAGGLRREGDTLDALDAHDAHDAAAAVVTAFGALLSPPHSDSDALATSAAVCRRRRSGSRVQRPAVVAARQAVVRAIRAAQRVETAGRSGRWLPSPLLPLCRHRSSFLRCIHTSVLCLHASGDLLVGCAASSAAAPSPPPSHQTTTPRPHTPTTTTAASRSTRSPTCPARPRTSPTCAFPPPPTSLRSTSTAATAWQRE
ncbi:hypothetical protein DFJ73DRAFT_828075 [Zopfochytrium polystomum]|nr:hypothetical protein DFJ73DRAFT_828075 [Zopfochytrium polystomum]